jgi:hypothetical protein
VLAVDLELVAQQPQAARVALGVAGVEGPELAEPDGRAGAPHELGPLEELRLHGAPVEVLAAGLARVPALGRDAGQRVVVRRVDGVVEHLGEHGEVGGVPVAVEEEHVARVDRADRPLQPCVERSDHLAARVGRLVERVVPGDPGLVPVALGQRLPQVHGAVLEVRVRPEVRPVRGVVRVPVLVLVPGHGVQVEDRVDAARRADLHDAVQAREALLLQDERRGVVLEVVVAERHAQGVDPEPGEVVGVGLGEEVGEEGVEERVGRLRAHRPAQGAAQLSLGRRVAGDEVLHRHPATEPEPAQQDCRAGAVDEPVTVHPDRPVSVHSCLRIEG